MSFIGELYIRKPLLVEKKIREWLNIGSSKKLKCVEINEEGLEFKIENPFIDVGETERTIYVTDTTLSDYLDEEEANLQYQKFMTRIFGRKYIIKIIGERRKMKDAMIEAFDEQTNELIDILHQEVEEKLNTIR